MSQLALISVAHTGHILGAVCRTTPLDAPASAGDLVGPGFPFREETTGARLMLVDASWLQVSLIDFRADILLDPSRFAKTNGDISTLVRPTALLPTQGGARLGGAGVSISTDTPAPIDRKVFVQVERASTNERYVLRGVLGANQRDVSLGGGGLSGSYQVLTLIAGAFPKHDMVTVA